MWRTLVISCVLASIAVDSFKISPRVDATVEPETIVSSPTLWTHKSLDPPHPDYATYEAIFAGIKKPITVDCTQPGVVCKFPLMVSEEKPPKPIKIKEVPIIKGAILPDVEGREEEETDTLGLRSSIDNGEVKVPIYKGTSVLDVESFGEKDMEDTWILEKNVLNKKYQIPVKIVPSKHQHGIAPVYPQHHDFHDHFNGDSYPFPQERHGAGWSPWVRAYPSVYNHPSHQPCQPPVYHHPPPCTPVITPTRKPVINIDDKVDKED